MTPSLFLRLAVVPALSLLSEAMDSVEARAMLIAIALQESRLLHRRQINGPARSFAQFERGGIAGVLNHHASRLPAIALCEMLSIAPTVDAVYAAIEYQDVLCAGFSRLLLWTSPRTLPGPSDAAWGWELYMECWRAGTPRRETWDAGYAVAWNAVLQGRQSTELKA